MVLFVLMLSGCATSHVGVNASLPQDQNIVIKIETTTEKP